VLGLQSLGADKWLMPPQQRDDSWTISFPCISGKMLVPSALVISDKKVTQKNTLQWLKAAFLEFEMSGKAWMASIRAIIFSNKRCRQILL
jgi:hypothetical protein